MDSSAIIYRFQEALREFLDEETSLEVFIGNPPAGPERDYREAAMKLFWIKRGKGTASA